MGLFDNIGSAKRQFGRNYVRPGHYIVRVDDTQKIKTRSKGDAFKIGMTVLHTIDDNQGRGHKMGEQVSWMATEQPFPEGFLSRVKTAVLVISDQPEWAITKEAMEEIISVDQPLAGYCVELTCREIPKKNQPANQVAGSPPEMTTVVNWNRFVPGEEIIEILKSEDQRTVKVIYPNGIDAVKSTDVPRPEQPAV